jgi:hypothetical protein
VRQKRTDESGWTSTVQAMAALANSNIQEDDATAISKYLARSFTPITPKLELPIHVNTADPQIIANGEVEKIVIEQVAGGRPVATGAVYKDKTGKMNEVRAARVICACAANGTPLLLYKSGYGPRELLGDSLLVENANVGQHMTGDCSMHATAGTDQPG